MTTATKHDNNKPDHSLIPKVFLDQLSQVMMTGVHKYGRYNYKGGFFYSRLIAACSRHLSSFNSGVDIDEESGLSHLAHAACCLLMLIDTISLKTSKDDRYGKEVKEEAKEVSNPCACGIRNISCEVCENERLRRDRPWGSRDQVKASHVLSGYIHNHDPRTPPCDSL